MMSVIHDVMFDGLQLVMLRCCHEVERSIRETDMVKGGKPSQLKLILQDRQKWISGDGSVVHTAQSR